MLTDLQTDIYKAREQAAKELEKYKDAYNGRYYLSVDDILDAHFLLADFFIDSDDPMTYGVKNAHLLASSLDRQIVGYDGKRKWNDQFEIIATLFYGLIKNHAFHDGNKRTALLTVLYHLWTCGRVYEASQKDLENLTVHVAENSLKTKYKRYSQFAKQEDSEIHFLAWFFRKNSRTIDRSDYTITYRQLDSILHNYDFMLANHNKNCIDVIQKTKVKKWKLFKSYWVTEEKYICQVNFPGWKRQVPKGVVQHIRKETKLIPENGYDSQVFFKGISPLDAFIATYEVPLRRLATR